MTYKVVAFSVPLRPTMLHTTHAPSYSSAATDDDNDDDYDDKEGKGKRGFV